MYRIHFDPRAGAFVVQVLKWGLFWVTVPFDYSFITYAEAQAHIKSIGLDQLYQDCSENVRQNYLHSA